jgi:hypothetical protein
VSPAEESNLVWSDLNQQQYQELDPDMAVKGEDSQAGVLYWQPPRLEDERYWIVIRHRSGTVTEDLRITKVGEEWAYALNVVDETLKRNLMLCKDPKFPTSSEWPSGLPNCFPHYPDRYRDLSRYELLVSKAVGLK